MNSHRALKVLALALVLAVGGLFLWRGRQGQALREPARVTLPAEPAAGVQLEAPAAEELREVAVGEREEADRPPGPASAAAVSAPWDGPLAGLTGRIVEADGTPVAGIPVALFELDPELLFADDTPGAAPVQSLAIERAATDELGRFLMGGARAPAYHGLGIDVGGPRASLRVIDSALAHERLTDLGDIVLAPFGILTGRIVDQNGRPVGGARIRMGPFPEEILLGAPYELRTDSLAAVSMLLQANNRQGVIEPPPVLRHAIEDFPVPTTYSDDEGYFRLEGVALAELVGGVDQRGYAGLPLGPIDMRQQAEQDLGDLVLTRGRTIEGYVESSDGDPVAGVEVFAGAEVPAGFVAILQPCGPTDAEGYFSLSGVPAEGQVVAVARRSWRDPWVSEVTLEHDDVLLVFEPTVELTVLVKDEAGAPLRGAHVALRPASEGEGMMGVLTAVDAFLPRAIPLEDGFREVEPGRYVSGLVSAGSFDVTARVRGRAPGQARAELVLPQHTVEVVCPAGEYLDVAVVDGATGEPVPEATLRVLAMSEETGFDRLAGGTSDASGRARLGPLPPREPRAEPAILIARHPRYADHSLVLGSAAAEVVVPLEGGGALAGLVHLAGELPTRPYMVLLQYLDAEGRLELFHWPRFGVSDPFGAFRIESLTAGTYELQLVERFLDRDPFGLVSESFEPATVYSEEIVVERGRTTEVEIDLTSTGLGPTVRLQGRVRVGGRELAGAEVSVRSNGGRRVLTDSGGWYDTGELALAESVRIVVEGDVGFPCAGQRATLYRDSIDDIRAGETRQIDIDLFPLSSRVEVVDGKTGAPIADAEVSAVPTGAHEDARGNGPQGSVNTDRSGEASLCFMVPGEYRLVASAAEYADGSLTVAIAEHDDTLERIELLPAVPFSGRVVVPVAFQEGERFSYIAAYGEGGGVSTGAPISPPDYAFDLEGLSEGDYRVRIHVNGRASEELSVSLGPDGERDLYLDFVPAEE